MGVTRREALAAGAAALGMAGRRAGRAVARRDATGRWRASVVAERTITVRALRPVGPAVVSDVLELAVAPVITLKLASSYPPRVTGTVHPAKATVTIDVYRDVLARALISSTTVRVRRGRFSFRPQIGVGIYTVIARTAPDLRNAAGTSAPLQIIH